MRVLKTTPVYVNILRAADFVAPLLSVGVDAGVEVRVIQDDRVGVKHRSDGGAAAVGQDAAEQLPVPVESVDAVLRGGGGNKVATVNEPSQSREKKMPSGWSDTCLSILGGEAFVDPDVGELPVIEKGLQDVQHLHHLCEDDDASAVRPQLLQQNGQSFQFACKGKQSHNKTIASFDIEIKCLKTKSL